MSCHVTKLTLVGSAHFTVITTFLYHTHYTVIYSIFWDFTQRKLVVSYRPFGTTYRSHLQGSRSLVFVDCLTPKDGDRSVVPICR
jgi:hypothetical protein